MTTIFSILGPLPQTILTHLPIPICCNRCSKISCYRCNKCNSTCCRCKLTWPTIRANPYSLCHNPQIWTTPKSLLPMIWSMLTLTSRLENEGPKEYEDVTTRGTLPSCTTTLAKWFHSLFSSEEVHQQLKNCQQPSNAPALQMVQINPEVKKSMTKVDHEKRNTCGTFVLV